MAKKPVHLSVSIVILDIVSVSFSYGYKKLYFKTYVRLFSSRFDAMDINNMNFVINDFMMKNSSFVMIDKSTKDSIAVKAIEAESTTPLTVTLKNADIRKLIVQYKNESRTLDYSNVINNLQLQDATLHLQQEYVSAKSITLNKCNAV